MVLSPPMVLLLPAVISIPLPGDVEKFWILKPLITLLLELIVRPLTAGTSEPSMITPALEASIVILPWVIEGKAEVTEIVAGVPVGKVVVLKSIVIPAVAVVMASRKEQSASHNHWYRRFC